jgi:hypothetical protein
MPLLRSIPSTRIINGHEVKTSETLLISEPSYVTNGEYAIVVKTVDYCELTLNSKTTDHVVIKALTTVLIKPDRNKIDEEYDEVEINKGACIELFFMGGNWYILSSDGLKF